MKWRFCSFSSETRPPCHQALTYSIVQFAAFLSFSTKKYRIFDGSEFSTKGHDNLWCLLLPTTQIFERQFAWNESWLRFFKGKFALFDKWLRPFERNFALYLLCSNIPKDFLDDNFLSSNLPQWFFSYVASMCKLYDKLVSIYITVL